MSQCRLYPVEISFALITHVSGHVVTAKLFHANSRTHLTDLKVRTREEAFQNPWHHGRLVIIAMLYTFPCLLCGTLAVVVRILAVVVNSDLFCRTTMQRKHMSLFRVLATAENISVDLDKMQKAKERVDTHESEPNWPFVCIPSSFLVHSRSTASPKASRGSSGPTRCGNCLANPA